MKYCEKCNKYYSEDKRYCSECGCILINKDKSQNSSKAGNVHCDIENLEIPPYEHFLMQFLIPTVIGLSIAELIFYMANACNWYSEDIGWILGKFCILCCYMCRANESSRMAYRKNTLGTLNANIWY